MLPATLTFAQTHDCDVAEQYVDWGNNINFIFMRDQNSPHPMTNMLNGGNNSNFIFMRDQNQEGGTSTPGKRPGCSEHV